MVNGLDWQCCLAGSSKTAPGILIFFSIAMGANYLFYLKSIATYAPTFLGYYNSFLVIVKSHWSNSNRQGLTPNVFPLLKFEAIIEFFTELNQMFSNHVEMTMYKIQF